MNIFILKLFVFLRSCIQLIKIIIMFLVMLFLLYWIQNLLCSEWAWLGFVKPFFDFILSVGERISAGGITLFNAIFEFKYGIGLIIFVLLQYLLNFLLFIVNKVEDLYDDARILVKKTQEKIANNSLQSEQKIEQKKINKYQVYIHTKVKDRFLNKNYNIDIEEQNQLMNSFITKKLGVCPQQYLEGFLLTLHNFNNVDSVFDVLNKLINSKAPIDFQICVQVLDSDELKQKENLQKMINLKIYNKIISLANTVYRYEFNLIKRYIVVNLGIYQYNGETFEASEFLLEENKL